MPKSIEQQLIATYFSLRAGLVVMAVAFPWLLWLGGMWYAGVGLQDSMSLYYHAAGAAGHSMRDWFVGVLFAVGALLYLYKGFSLKENVALNLAGGLAVGIAIFPSAWGCEPNCPAVTLHGVCAVSFFLCIAFVCEFCSGDTLPLVPDPKTRARYKRAYRAIAILMVVTPLAAWALNEKSKVFFVEAGGIYVFAAYWFVKSKELALTQVERRALHGEFEKGMGAAGGGA